MKLNATNVNTVFLDSLFKDNELTNGEPTNFIKAEAVMTKVGFHPERLESHRNDIKTMLSELPEPFFKNMGGGWTFLNAIETKDGEQWAELIIFIRSLDDNEVDSVNTYLMKKMGFL